MEKMFKNRKSIFVNAILPFIISIFVFVLLPFQGYAQVYVSPTGSDGGLGTYDSPFLNLSTALAHLDADSLVYMLGGTYPQTGSISITKSGNANTYIRVWAYQNEVPVLDFSSMPAGSTDGVKLSASYIYLKGLTMTGAPHNGLNVSGSNNKIENCVFHDNRNSGFQMGSSSSLADPGNNLILNCDSYRNYNTPDGGNADGYAVKWNIGTGNIFRGCRSYNNSDDGWDLWMAINTVVIESCMAFRNGVDTWHYGGFAGNGNGFKLGGYWVATPHTVTNCVSFDNAGNTGRGFDENNDTAGLTLYNNTAYRNKGDNYHFTNVVKRGYHTFKNNLSYRGNVSITSGVQSNNSWQSDAKHDTVAMIDFQSLDTSMATLPRDSNGYLQVKPFLRLSQRSWLIDAGIDVGIPYWGYAPDIGAYEYYIPVPTYALTVYSTNGVVTVSPNKTTFDSGMVVQLTAIANRGYHFVNWSGDTNTIANPLSLPMNTNKSITANFALNTYSLTLDTTGEGIMVVTPNQTLYDTGTVVILTALAATDWRFDHWSGDINGALSPDTIIMNGNMSVTANFIPDTVTLPMNMSTNWNLISLPVRVANPRKAVIFPSAISDAYGYAGMYVSKDTIQNGIGYWLKFPSVQLLHINGIILKSDTIHVNTGWNIIGSISHPVAIHDVIQNPPGIIHSPLFGYNTGYSPSDTIYPGKGYWIKIDSAGSLFLPVTTMKKK